MSLLSAGVLKRIVRRRNLPTGARCQRPSTVHENKNRLLAPVKSFLLIPFVSLCASVVPLAAQGEVGVWMQSPKPGLNPNTVQVVATAYSASAVTGWIIYVDDAIAFQSNYSTDTLSHTLTLSNGKHLIYARAWTYDGFGTSDTEMIQVGPQPAISAALPTPPPNATVLSQIQDTSDGWKDCSLCAAGTNDTTNYWMAPFQSSPSMTGSSRELYADGLPWTNVLFIKTMPGTSSASHFLWDFWVYHDPTSAANIWSSEFDLWQTLGGREFMMGSQCDFGDGYWDTWDSANDRWIENGVPCPRWAPNTWHHIQWYVERIGPAQYRYDTLVVDGRTYGFNQVWAVNPTTWGDAVGIQWQLDQSADGDPIHQWIDNVKLTLW
jgi:hypothetical protein